MLAFWKRRKTLKLAQEEWFSILNQVAIGDRLSDVIARHWWADGDCIASGITRTAAACRKFHWDNVGSAFPTKEAVVIRSVWDSSCDDRSVVLSHLYKRVFIVEARGADSGFVYSWDVGFSLEHLVQNIENSMKSCAVTNNIGEVRLCRIGVPRYSAPLSEGAEAFLAEAESGASSLDWNSNVGIGFYRRCSYAANQQSIAAHFNNWMLSIDGYPESAAAVRLGLVGAGASWEAVAGGL